MMCCLVLFGRQLMWSCSGVFPATLYKPNFTCDVCWWCVLVTAHYTEWMSRDQASRSFTGCGRPTPAYSVGSFVMPRIVNSRNSEYLVISDTSLVGQSDAFVLTSSGQHDIRIVYIVQCTVGYTIQEATSAAFVTSTCGWTGNCRQSCDGFLRSTVFDALRCTVFVIVILSVCLSVRPSHSWTVSTPFDLRSWFLHHMVAPSF